MLTQEQIMKLVIGGFLEAAYFCEDWKTDEDVQTADEVFHEDSLAVIDELCQEFLHENAHDLIKWVQTFRPKHDERPAARWECVGRDIYFSARGHSIGFIDRDSGDDSVAVRLVESAYQDFSFDIECDDDGLLHINRHMYPRK